MLLSELTTIYLAAAAPVGVAYFLRQQQQDESEHVARNIAHAAGVALVWPLALVFLLLCGKSSTQADDEPTLPMTTQPGDEARLAQALRLCLDALHETEDRAQEAFAGHGEQVRHALLDTCSSLERHAGLTRAVMLLDEEDATPSARELELARVAGRGDDDLQVAGRCIQRRHSARLRAHHMRARVELLHALAEIHEVIDRGYLFTYTDKQLALHFSAAVLQFYVCVNELLTLLGERATAEGVARLIDAANARVRALQSMTYRELPLTETGDELCANTMPPRHSNVTQFSPRAT